VIKVLRHTGSTVRLDDFGPGVSSRGCLTRNPIDTSKSTGPSPATWGRTKRRVRWSGRSSRWAGDSAWRSSPKGAQSRSGPRPPWAEPSRQRGGGRGL